MAERERAWTPGAWSVATNANDIPCIVQCAEHRIASAYFNGRDDGLPPNRETAAANAALIAAAPDLYEALEYVVDQTAPLHGLAHVTGAARAAIAKAEPQTLSPQANTEKDHV